MNSSVRYHPELVALDQWVVWKYEKTIKGDLTKVPYNPKTGHKASSTDAATWATFKVAAAAKGYDGLGFVFSEDDDYTGVDLDHCRDPQSGAIDPWAKGIVEWLDTYAEVSPSGTGIHFWLRAKLHGERRKGLLAGNKVEIYDQKRFFTVVGVKLECARSTIESRQSELDDLYRSIFEEKVKKGPTLNWQKSASEGTDTDLLAYARDAKDGPRFIRLYDRGDTSEYGDDDSSADMALCCLLAYWTENDVARIDRLFRQSALMRDKWDDKRGQSTYGRDTISNAIAFRGNGSPSGTSSNGLLRRETDEAPKGFALTDLGNAERLVDRHGVDLRYCFPWKAWLIWNGTHWERDESNQVERYAKATVRLIYSEAANVEDIADRKALVKHALRSEAESRIKAMISLASSEASIPVEPAALDSDSWLLNVANGTIDLRTGQILPHQRHHLITRRCPIIYDPEASSALWQQFLLDTTDRDAEMIAFLQRAVGYSLTGSTQEEKLFFVHGPSRTGKSTFLDAMKMILGSYGMTADFESFLVQRDSSGPRQDIARLAGARFVVSIEVDEGKRLAEGLVKILTGGDQITARFLYGREFEFTPAFKLWLAANASPKARTDDDAIWNRIIRIPFHQVVPKEKRDPKVKLALRDPKIAGPALLAWAVKGCLAWQRDGLRIPKVVQDSSEGYRMEVDQLAGFIEDCCELQKDAFAWSTALTERYKSWARANDEKKILLGKAFGARLRARGCEPGHRQKGELGLSRCWNGIKLRDYDDE